jgi:ion channel-forming bestrophin family protein
MIAYNPKEWFGFIFKIHKADTIRKLFLMIILIALYTFIIAWLELKFWNIAANNGVRNLTQMHTLLGFVLSLLLVFRTNTAYDRWWEGRKLWGALVNNSRNFALKINTFLGDDCKKEKRFFEKLIPFYAATLRSHLIKESTRLELDETITDLGFIDVKKHIPNQISGLLFGKVNQLYKNKQLTNEQFLQLNIELSAFADICGACERIKNTPIPFSYSLFVKKFIFFYVMTLPFGIVFNLGFFAIPVVAFVFYVLSSLELIAEEIEDPFGADSNDLPTQKITEGIKKSVEEILR